MTLCVVTGFQCHCQPDEGVTCTGVHELRTAYAEWRARTEKTAQENERLRKALSQRLQQLEEIRQASLTWAMACPHNCEACEAMYEVIKGSSGHPGAGHVASPDMK